MTAFASLDRFDISHCVVGCADFHPVAPNSIISGILILVPSDLYPTRSR
jgi:hypothetical protein